MTPTLFQKVLGTSFYSLPPVVRSLHAVRGQATYAGRATIVRGESAFSRMCARIAHLPPAGEDVVTRVVFVTDGAGESWQRDFAGHTMHSRLRVRDKLLEERLGPLQFRFALHVYDDALHWRVQRVRLLGILPLPSTWFAGVHCREREHKGRYEFQVEASMPLIGQLVLYQGWLEPVEPATP
jgi:hypothetical protein